MNILTSLCSYSSLSVVGKSSAQLWPVIKTSQISLVLQLCSRGLFIQFFPPPFIWCLLDGWAEIYGGRTSFLSSSSTEGLDISLKKRERQEVVVLNPCRWVVRVFCSIGRDEPYFSIHGRGLQQNLGRYIPQLWVFPIFSLLYDVVSYEGQISFFFMVFTFMICTSAEAISIPCRDGMVVPQITDQHVENPSE